MEVLWERWTKLYIVELSNFNVKKFQSAFDDQDPHTNGPLWRPTPSSTTNQVACFDSNECQGHGALQQQGPIKDS